MLDRAQLLHEIARFSDYLFYDNSQEYDLARSAWNRLITDESLRLQISLLSHYYELPSFHDIPNHISSVEPMNVSYTILSVDGSQIYPDRHCGISCHLINIGLVSLSYGIHQKPLLKTIPYVFNNSQDDQFIDFSPEMVNGKRQELELQHGFDLSLSIDCTNKILLFDGSLIFWHLERKESSLKERFFEKYLCVLEQLNQEKIITASYISMPRSRELVNMLRHVLAEADPNRLDQVDPLRNLTDASIAQFFLKPKHRSIIFKNNSSINLQYSAQVTTYFFYLHVGNEIGRVEIPAWVAVDHKLVDFVARTILDQCIKGRGYPVALAEAHEQAVVKGPDREFFYHVIQKLSIEKKQRIVHSQKSVKKRGMAI